MIYNGRVDIVYLVALAIVAIGAKVILGGIVSRIGDRVKPG